MAAMEVRFSVPADPVAVAEARRRVASFDGLPERVIADAEVVVSELVTNSILHAGLRGDEMIDIVLRREAAGLVIEVDDRDGLHGGSGHHPAARRPGGMGFRVLDALCEDWRADGGRVIASVPLT